MLGFDRTRFGKGRPAIRERVSRADRTVAVILDEIEKLKLCGGSRAGKKAIPAPIATKLFRTEVLTGRMEQCMMRAS